MTFLWPGMLIGVMLEFPLFLGCIWHHKPQAAQSVDQFWLFNAGKSDFVQDSAAHVPPALFLLSLLIILLALARPQAQVSLPRVEGTVIMVLDVSASMGATDVDPSRLEVAKAAAREFIQSQPETVKIGMVSFSSSGFTIETPSRDTAALLSAIDRLQPTAGTSLGQGILPPYIP